MESMLSVEVPRSALAALRALPRVARLVPVHSYKANDVDSTNFGSPSMMPPTPIGASTDPLNHNVAGAWGILGAALGTTSGLYRGSGARVAVFDTGIDKDVDGRTPALDHHPSFAVPGGTRLEAHLQAQSAVHVDCNTINTSYSSPYCGGLGPFGYRPLRQAPFFAGHNAQCGHGTAMAAIIAGGAYTGIASGHSPEAAVVDVAISSRTYDPVSSVYFGADALWEATDSSFLSAIEQLREYILLHSDGEDSAYVHVINISFGADPDPFNPAQMALDKLAREEDILIVVSAGNDTDTTMSSAGCYHALAVGAVHARTAVAPANFAFVPMLENSRGPLASDHRRFYPDVCATGAGAGSVVGSGGGATREFRYPLNWLNAFGQESCVLMPGIDLGDPGSTTGANTVTPLRWRYGTSEAAAQVSGAATLYRGFRLTNGTPATAEETRAAILLSVLGTYTDAIGANSDPTQQHAYNNRNTVGVGYVRDDMLADFAARTASISPLAQVVNVSIAATTASASYAGLVPGDRYAVVACWQRYVTSEVDPQELELPDVNLEVLAQGQVIARAATPANSYERLVFVAPSSGQVSLQATLASTTRPDQVAVQLVARKLATDIDLMTPVVDRVLAATGTVESLSAGPACSAGSMSWNVSSILPTSYSDAYGSLPFRKEYEQVGPGQTPGWWKHHGYTGGELGWSPSSVERHLQLCANAPPPGVLPVVPAGTTRAIGGIAFRSWRPMVVGGGVTMTIRVAEGTFSTSNVTGASLAAPVTSSNTMTYTVTLRDPGPEVQDDFNQFTVIAPFAIPFQWGGKDLHFWFQVPVNSNVFLLDAIYDGWEYSWLGGAGSAPGLPPAGVGMHWIGSGGSTHHVVRTDYMPVIGLLDAPSVSAREPLLEVLGSTWSGQGLHVRLMRTPSSAPTSLYVGDWTGIPVAIGPCGFLLGSNAQPVAVAIDANGIGELSIAVPTGLEHFQMGLQAAILVSPGPSVVLSNGLRVTLGGAL